MVGPARKYVATLCSALMLAGCAGSATTSKWLDLADTVYTLDHDVSAGKIDQAKSDLDAVAQVDVSCKDFKPAGPDATGTCLKLLLMRDRDGAITMYCLKRNSDSWHYTEQFINIWRILGTAKIAPSGGVHDAFKFASHFEPEMSALQQKLERSGLLVRPDDTDPFHT